MQPSPGPQLVFLIGPAAVGKMTVGLQLQRATGFRLLHNHMTIDLVTPFFDFGTPAFAGLVSGFREQLVVAVANSDLPGLVFTYVWAFDDPADAADIERYASIFRERGRPVWFVELQASQEERLRRNRTDQRLQHKPSKRDLNWSDSNLRQLDGSHQLAAPEELRSRPDWLHLDTTALSAEETARTIMRRFDLPVAPSRQPVAAEPAPQDPALLSRPASEITAHGSSGVQLIRCADTDGLRVHHACLSPGGLLGRHRAAARQSFTVVTGSGWVAGPGGVRTPVVAGQGVVWEAGQEHESGTDTGMCAVLVEPLRIPPTPAGE